MKVAICISGHMRTFEKPDIFLEKINIFKTKKNVIIIPEIAKVYKEGITDQIAFASSEVMDIYSELFLKKDEIKNYNVLNHPEIILKKYIEIKFEDVVYHNIAEYNLNKLLRKQYCY